MSEDAVHATGAADYLRARRRPQPGPLHGPDLRSYAVDLRHRAWAADHLPESLWFRRAPSGLPLRKAVVPAAEAGLGYWQLLQDAAASERQFLLMADYLVLHSAPGPGGRGRAWYTPETGRRYPPWRGGPSARAQGQAISVLLRAHLLTGDERYLEIARQAFEPFTADVSEGGVSRRLDGRLVLEAHAGEQPVAILAGWLYALLGLLELRRTTGDERVGALLSEAVGDLLATLPRYDTGWWSLASLYEPEGRPDVATAREHRLAIVLLEGLAGAGLDGLLAGTARRWRDLDRPDALARLAWRRLR